MRYKVPTERAPRGGGATYAVESDGRLEAATQSHAFSLLKENLANLGYQRKDGFR